MRFGRMGGRCDAMRWDGFMIKDDSEVGCGRMPDRIFPGVASGVVGSRGWTSVGVVVLVSMSI